MLPAVRKLSEITGYSSANFARQGDFVEDRSRFSFAGAAIRTGKTYGAARQFADRVLEDYRTLGTGDIVTYWCVAPTYEEGIAQKIELFGDESGDGALIPDWLIDWTRQGDDKLFKNLKRGGGKVWLIGGRLIEFKTADKPESLVARKVRGVWWTEIARSKYAAWPNVRGRLSNYADSWLIADTSPMGRCWFYVELWEPAIKGRLPHASTHEWWAVHSPYIPREEIETARATMPSEFFRRDYEASWATFSGQIYGTFDRKVHMLDHCPFQPTSWWIAVDVNTIAENPSSFSVFGSGGRYVDNLGNVEKRLHKFSEHEERHGLDFESFADSIADKASKTPAGLHGTSIIIDPSAHRQFKQMLSERGLNVRNGKNDVLPGIRNLGAALQFENRTDGRPLYTIDKTCTSTASQFEGYAWKTSSSGVIVETPDKDALDPHLLDGDRYLSHEIWSGFTAPRQIR